jgi:ADP-heptose:LPS heptosyltransferase
VARRLPARLLVLRYALTQWLLSVGRRRPPSDPKRILIVHHLLLGDTLMLTPLIAKLRALFPRAEIVMTAPKAIAPLYQQRPYGVTALAWDPRDPGALMELLRHSGFDLAFVPGDNRHSWLALALGARWIVAFAGDRPAYKNWPVDEALPYPVAPGTWGDIVAGLAKGEAPSTYRPEAWGNPEHLPFDLPSSPYCVLHVGARTSHRQWCKARWAELATYLTRRGLTVVWSSGPGEAAQVSAIDPEGRYASYAGKLDLAQLWHLLKRAKLLVCPDTGIAHMGRVVNVPTVALFGPGSATLFGAGEFWKQSLYCAITVENFPCRDQGMLFKREIPWMAHCSRGPDECGNNLCMQVISLDTVESAIEGLLGLPGR